MQCPVKKEYITQEFGANPKDYAKYGLKGHNGLDFRAFNPDGSRCYEGGKSEVFAPHGGQILENYLDISYGWYVKIQDEKQGSILAHLFNQSPFKVGSTVKQGQLIGYQGTTGNSTGIHLHWGYYLLPRNKQNGYNGYINQAGLYRPYGEETMSKLLTHLDVPNDDEAIKKLVEHLGEENGKSNWGKTGDKGGYLGSERKLSNTLSDQNNVLLAQNNSHITELTAQLAVNAQLEKDVEALQAYKTQLEEQLADCEATAPEVEPIASLENGRQITHTVSIVTGNKTVTDTTSINYKPA